MGINENLLKWREKQSRGEIMKPSTFKGIVQKNIGKVGSKRAKKIAGKAYWKTAKAKFKRKKKKSLNEKITEARKK